MKGRMRNVKKRLLMFWKPYRILLSIRLARLRRRLIHDVTFIGVTGSCGKTTSTALIASILSSVGRCQSGIISNEARKVAQSILGIDSSTKFCVQELSATEIETAIKIFKPQIGVVTTVGSDHYKMFRSLGAVAQVKGHLIECLPKQGTAVLNADDPHIRGMAARTKARVITFGLSPDADIRAIEVSGSWPDFLILGVKVGEEVVRVETRLFGEHWLPSILAAIACGVACGVDLNTCAKAIASVAPTFARYSMHAKHDGPFYVLDTAKAPFWTIAAALAFIKNARAVRKTMVFGTISDYAGSGGSRYRRVAREALEVANRVVFVGPQSSLVDKLRQGELSNRLFTFQTTYQASAFLSRESLSGELIFIKASSTDHLERIMLSQLDQVVCWQERCGIRRPCPNCRRYRRPKSPPFGLVKSQRAAGQPITTDPNSGTGFDGR
jgi:UDP-N-acetylmuramoyl-tripeptide--D-alanyl-D-alanine ligase